MKKIIKVFLVISTLFFNSLVFADTNINLQIKTNTDTIYSNNINVSPCDSEGDGVMKITPYCALVQSGISSNWSGLWINSINDIVNNDGDNGAYWMWLANLNIKNSNPTDPYNLSSKQYILENNDNILFYYNTNPLDISVDNENPKVGESIKITIKELGLDSSWNPVWNNAVTGKVIINSNTYDLDENGIFTFEIKNGETLSIKAQKDNFIDSKELTISVITPPATNGGSGGALAMISAPSINSIPLSTPSTIVKPTFDVKKAFEFLIFQQKENGSFGEDIYTDWTSIAFSSNENFQDQKIKLKTYFEKLETSNYQLTDYERHTMALMSLGLNPYNVNNENYIQKIINGFDGKQFGDPQKDNDDIFALVVLQNAGYGKEESIIKNTITNILSQQKENGSWDDSVDMTGASIEALTAFKDPLLASPFAEGDKILNAIAKAENYLKQNQKDDGGFGNVSSTAWGIEGILALSEKLDDWIKNNNTPFDYLANSQDFDGGIKNEYLQNKIWETAYTLSAISGKTWNQIMQKFEKPKEEILPKENKIKEKIPKKIVKNYTKKAIIQNTATVINSFNENNTELTPVKKNWFKRFLDKIFNIF